jgi:hypothetical protein
VEIRKREGGRGKAYKVLEDGKWRCEVSGSAQPPDNKVARLIKAETKILKIPTLKHQISMFNDQNRFGLSVSYHLLSDIWNLLSHYVLNVWPSNP